LPTGIGDHRGSVDVVAGLAGPCCASGVEIDWHRPGHMSAIDHAALLGQRVQMLSQIVERADRPQRARRLTAMLAE
jgi:hypothetical protein